MFLKMGDVKDVCILALDIGGTNPRMAMMKVNARNDYEILLKRDVDKDQDSILPSINDFLAECSEKGFTTNTCCACVAGPVDVSKNACYNPTNARFPIIAQEIIEGSFLENVLVINDFKAIGESIAALDLSKESENVIQIPGFLGDDFSEEREYFAKPDSKGARGVIGPGTGLGIAYISNTPYGLFVNSSEGGHAGSPTRGDYSLLYNFIRNKLDVEHVGMEALVSGQGIEHIIDFFVTHPRAFLDLIESNLLFKVAVDEFEEDSGLSDGDIEKVMLGNKDGELKEDVAKLVATNINSNPKALITMRLFFEFLGNAAQAVALHGNTVGGLFIAGGIPSKNRKLLLNGDFMKSFCDNWKPNIRELLKNIPVYLLTDYDISFYGCARAADVEFGDDVC